MAKATVAKKQTFPNLPKNSSLAWLNKTLQANVGKIEELKSGVGYCQLMHMLFPASIQIERVKLGSNKMHEHLFNMKLLRNSFNTANVRIKFNKLKIVEGDYAENLHLLEWFQNFFDANNNNINEESYNTVLRGNNESLASGSQLDGINPKVSTHALPKKSSGLICPKHSNIPSTIDFTNYTLLTEQQKISKLEDEENKIFIACGQAVKAKHYYCCKLHDIEELIEDENISGDDSFVKKVLEIIRAPQEILPKLPDQESEISDDSAQIKI